MIPKTPFRYELWINGKEVPSGSGKRFERRSPAHNVVVGDYAEAGIADGDAAVHAARAAFDRGPWPHSSGAREEIFGPVLSILTFDTAEEAIEIANSTNYGLSSGIWTRDLDTALSVSRRIRAGTIWVNTFMDGYPELPFGGYKESGQGRELGRFAIEEFTELKTIQMHLGPSSSWSTGQR